MREILAKQIEQFGDGEIYVMQSVEKGIWSVDIKTVGLDAFDKTVVDVTVSE